MIDRRERERKWGRENRGHERVRKTVTYRDVKDC